MNRQKYGLFARGGTWQRLPLHPPPAPFEALSSYVARLATANALTVEELGKLAETTANWQSSRNAPDLSIDRALGLLPLTGCTQTALKKMTAHLLGQCFGVAYSILLLRRFLHGSLAPSQRYCPFCLAEDDRPYLRLHWRFLALSGCSIHFCQFQDRCDHCHTLLPYHPRQLRLTLCPSCSRDLRTAQPPPLPESSKEKLLKRTADLTFLLNPALPPQNLREPLARRYIFLRELRGQRLQEVAQHLQKDPIVLAEIESAGPYRRTTFLCHLQYADFLGYSFRDLLAMDLS